MNYLAIDTSGKRLSVAARKGDTLVISDKPCILQHSVLLMDEADTLLSRANLTLSGCDFLACTVGPGSFTGIRIGISAVKGMAFGAEKPVLAVTSFDAVAYADAREKKIAAIDAGHGCVYAKGYGVPLEAGHYPVEEILRLAERYEVPILSADPLPFAEQADAARGLAACADANFAQAGDLNALCALYLRKSSAEEQR